MKWALLANIEDAATNVLTLTESLEPEELFRSRLTRAEVQRNLVAIEGALAHLGAEGRKQMPELDWDAWQKLGALLLCGGPQLEDALWFGVRSLTPATLMWLRVYRARQPELFQFKL